MCKKYKVKHTSIMHNGSLVKEGDVIELTDAQAEKLADFVVKVSEPKTQIKQANQTKTSTKSKTETKSEKDKSGTKTVNGEGSDGGTDNGK